LKNLYFVRKTVTSLVRVWCRITIGLRFSYQIAPVIQREQLRWNKIPPVFVPRSSRTQP